MATIGEVELRVSRKFCSRKRRRYPGRYVKWRIGLMRWSRL